MEERKIYPLRFIPAEGYLLADLGFADSMAGEGWLGGNTIGELMQTYMEKIVGDPCFEYYGLQFPVTVRLIETDCGIPVTVNPDDVTAQARYDSLGRTAFLYVISAEPGARLRLGFSRDVPSAELYHAALEGRITELLNDEPLSKGDGVLVTPGTVYSVSGKVTMVEISEASALGFRIDGGGEELLEAFDFIDYSRSDTSLNVRRAVSQRTPGEPRPLFATQHFTVSDLLLDQALRISPGERDGFSLYVPVSGEAVIQWKELDGKPSQTRLRRGECVLVPADTGEFLLVPASTEALVLEVLPGNLPPSEQTFGEESFEQDQTYPERNRTWTR